MNSDNTSLLHISNPPGFQRFRPSGRLPIRLILFFFGGPLFLGAGPIADAGDLQEESERRAELRQEVVENSGLLTATEIEEHLESSLKRELDRSDVRQELASDMYSVALALGRRGIGTLASELASLTIFRLRALEKDQATSEKHPGGQYDQMEGILLERVVGDREAAKEAYRRSLEKSFNNQTSRYRLRYLEEVDRIAVVKARDNERERQTLSREGARQ